MSRSALKELASQEFLRSEWGKMFHDTSRSGRESRGADRISLNYFEQYKSHYIKELASELRAGKYAPYPLTPHFIPKASGKDRVICVPTVRDRLLQRALAQLLHEKGYSQENPISYGFIKGRSVKSAATKAVTFRTAHPWAYKADISSFFDRIDRAILADKIRNKIRTSSLHPLLVSISNTEISAIGSSAQKRIKALGIKRGEGLRQGMPISPYLANLMLDNFDRRLGQKGIHAIRYADDLIAFCDTKEECLAVHDLCVDLLSEEKLSIHPLDDDTKTAIAAPGETIEFLGLGLAPKDESYELIVTEKQLETIKGKLLSMSNIEKCLQQRVTLSTFINKLEGRITGFRGAYDLCQNTVQLEDTLSSAKAKTLKKLFSNLGIDYSSLTKKQLSFLEVC